MSKFAPIIFNATNILLFIFLKYDLLFNMPLITGHSFVVYQNISNIQLPFECTHICIRTHVYVCVSHVFGMCFIIYTRKKRIVKNCQFTLNAGGMQLFMHW